MLDDTETLDSVFSFLAQIDLPCDLRATENESDTDEMLLPALSVGISYADEARLDALCHDDFDLPEAETPALTPDQDSQSIGSPQSSEASSLRTTKSRSKRNRVSRKQQIITLKEEVRELNELLRNWQPKSNVIVAPSPNELLAPHLGLLWQKLAARQLERRVMSEEENARLKEMMQIQILEARNLRRILKRRSRIDMMEEMFGVKQQKLTEYRIPDDNPQVREPVARH